MRSWNHSLCAAVCSALLVLSCGLWASKAVFAAPIVLANRTEAPIRFAWSDRGPTAGEMPVIASQSDLGNGKEGGETAHQGTASSTERRRVERGAIEPGDIAVIRVEPGSRVLVRWEGGDIQEIEPYSAYYFGTNEHRRVELRQIGLGNVAKPEGALTPRGGFERAVRRQSELQNTDRTERGTIRVALYVDDEEAMAKSAWQKRLRDRLLAASEIIERTCGMKLEIASYGEWQTTDSVTDFHHTLREFERAVRPRDARLAIGFTSQYQLTRGRTHLGGTRGPMASHILLREWSKHVSEAERLELLVHELCHFLGAAHSPESISVMRPVLGDRQVRLKSFTIAVDPVNALVMNLVADEIRDGGLTSFGQISDITAARLRIIYQVLAEATPDDPAAKDFLEFLDRRAAIRRGVSPIAPVPGGN
jgi:metallopeptidase family M12-like protein